MTHAMLPGHKLWGFDSFAGLPESVGSIQGWASGSLKPRTTEERLVVKSGGSNTTKIIRGFFNESLTEELPREEGMKPALYVDIDCDLFVSTTSALDWLFRTGLAQPGTLIGYDDWWTIPCNTMNKTSPLDVGEGLAHSEVAERYGVYFECIAGPCRPAPATAPPCHKHKNWAPVFMVTAIGVAQSSHGFMFDRRGELSWIKTNGVCKSMAQARRVSAAGRGR
jgi:hypothetical protein